MPDASSNNPRRRVLISANAVSPARGSEPGVGWQVCSRLARFHDVTVLCAAGVSGPDATCFRDEITAHGPVPGLTIRYVDPPLLSFLFQRETALCRRTFYYTGYKSWQRAAYKVAVDLHREKPFDLIHQLNMTGYREPGYLWKIAAPFVWGPVGGAANYPPGFYDLLGRRDRLFYSVRTGTNRLQSKSKRCRQAAEKSKHVWAISSEDVDLIRSWGVTAERMLETGATARDAAAVRTYDGTRPLRVVWSGRHLGRKALPILLQTAAKLKDRVELVVLGDGPETAAWKSLAASLGVDKIRWTGNLTQADALAESARADVLAFTSVLEGTPHVVVESLSLGLPVVCHDACGMGAAVTDECGVLIPMRNSEESVAAFTEALRSLAADPAMVVRLSRGALARAAELSWDRIAERIAAVYERILEPATSDAGLSGR
jgi:glycosyltransferase involved in cell wall biosynthesis